MKNEVIFDKFYVGLFVCFLILMGIILNMFHENSKRVEESMALFEKMDCNGIIVSIGNLNRGDYSFEIKANDSIIEITKLTLMGNLKEYNISVKDSISKIANSNIVNFYKKKDSIYYKIYEHQF
ncbi:MAG: hypothetical protein V4613_00980 [Bacteroidota bacterium]